ncbi:hypothetical protein [Mongoliimonas terrestris]|uniref:hypothetical protein n=1 Tax=Mongoliimonas terrestris TaxID=1709001 RepID=UPI0009496A49|nr:hypothetical protein [Mongoliimonas terrestris]
MRGIGLIIAIILVVAVAVGLYTMVDIDQTQEAQLPNVTVEGGQAPEFDVRTGSVDVETETREVEVPTIRVNPPAE